MLMNPEYFMASYSALVAAFPDTVIPPLTAKVFFAALCDIPDDLITGAAAEWLAHGKRFPYISDLRELALSERYPLASEAWGEVKRAFQQHGRHEKPVFSHPLIAATVEDIGWRGMCASEVNDEPIIRAQFRRAYQERVSRETFDRTSLVNALHSLRGDDIVQAISKSEHEESSIPEKT
jgi:hypothetical protein